MTENEKNARIFKAFCDANRWKILGLLQSGEKCACKLLEELMVGTANVVPSYENIMRCRNIVGGEEGKWTYYSSIRKGLSVQRNC